MHEENRISFCTVCMNRLKHLEQTLLPNIKDNSEYQNIEFVLLDYNSKDGLEDYVKSKARKQIEAGKLVYYKTTTPRYFSQSHSRNLAFKLSTGSIICNVDADNFTGKDFSYYVNSIFERNQNIFLTTHGLPESQRKNDILGRFCVTRNDFIRVGGFDERMLYYGFEDYDIVNRLQLAGLEKMLIWDDTFLNAIPHSNSERLANERVKDKFSELYIRYINPDSSQLLFLFNDKKFKKGTIQSNISVHSLSPFLWLKMNPTFEYSILEGYWEEGEWMRADNILELMNEDGTVKHYLFSNELENYVYDLKDADYIFYNIQNPNLTEDALFFYSQISNRLIMEKNLKQKVMEVNLGGFGHDTVYKNFDTKHPIIVQ